MIKKIILYVGLWQIIIILLTSLFLNKIPLQITYLGGALQAYIENPILNSRANFDGNHYISIAQNGYGYAQQAFFPLYPRLINLVSNILGDKILAGSLISVLCFQIALIVIYKLVKIDYSDNVAKWTILSLIFFPTSFYFSFVYTEGLFLLLVTLSVYFCRKRHWLMSVVCAALASYCRVNGIFLVPLLIVELFQQKQFKPLNILLLLIAPIGLLIYMLELYINNSDPLAFLHVQKLFNQGRSDSFILLPQVVWRYVKMIGTVDRTMSLYITVIFEFITSTVIMILTYFTWKKIRKSYSIFAICCFILPTLTGSFTSMPRYVLVSFPLFILIGILLSNTDNRAKYTYIIGCGVLFVTFITLFINGYWVA